MYPFLLIPKLPGKNALSKIITIDTEFYEKRRLQLSHFLNFLMKHNKLGKTKEFYKFLHDPDLDIEFFKNNELPYRFPEAEKLTDNVTSKLYGVFSNFFAKPEENIITSDKENKIKKATEFYKSLAEGLKEIKTAMV
jgi:hypothetical protein